MIDEHDAWDWSVDELLKGGIMALVDSREQDKIMQAQSVTDARGYNAQMARIQNDIEALDGKNEPAKLSFLRDMLKELKENKYTHSEIHAISIYGNLASMIPEANKTMGPRITYQAAMSKQALNQFHTLTHERFDSTIKVMVAPSLPLFQSENTISTGLTVMPSGSTIIKAIYAHPDNPEDGIVVNKKSIEAGKFKIIKYITFKVIIKTNAKEELKLLPDKSKNHRFHAISETGLPKLNVYVTKDDCILAKAKYIEGDYRNTSVYVGIGEEGYVHRILITKCAKGKLIKIKLKQIRNMVEGDKFASRYAQK